MNTFLESFRASSLGQNLSRLSPTQRAVFAVLFVLTLTGAGLMLRWANAPQFVTLYSDLNPAEMGPVVAAIEEEGIAFRFLAEGTTLQVAAEDRDRARGVLLKAGLPTSGRPGLELFDKPDWGMTDFTQKVKYRRGLEGEIARGISEIEGVQAARVSLVLPEKTPFGKHQQDARASVIVSLESGHSLERQTLDGIRFYLSSSVEGLRPDQVSIMDGKGKLLSAPVEDGLVGHATRQMELQREVERALAAKIESLLTSIMGEGNVRVGVTARLNFDRVERRVESIDPERQAILSEQKRTVSEGSAEGANTSTTNYETTREVQQITPGVGEVEHLSVSVLLNERRVVAEDGTVTFEALPEKQVAEVRRMVQGAMGFEETRGDRLEVANIRFDGLTEMEPVSEPMWKFAMRFSRPMISLLTLLLAFFLLRQVLQTLAKPAKDQEEARKKALETLANAPAVAATEEATVTGDPLAETARRSVEEDSEAAAALIRNLLQS